MEQIKATVEGLLKNNNFLIGVVVLCVLILICIFLFSYLNKKDTKKSLKQMETRYNSLKSVPLPFKVNKAESLARVNPVVAERVEHSREQHQLIVDELKDCSILMGEIDDLIYVHKNGVAKKQLKNLDVQLSEAEIHVNNLSQVLDGILEQESNQRDQINQLKTRFRIDKESIVSNRESFNSGIEVLEDRVVTIEKMFSTFEEWMFASEFDKANRQQVEIDEAIETLELLMREYPTLYEEAKGTLPKAIEDTSYVYSMARNKGVYLDHLDVTRNLESISGMLKEDLNRLSQGILDNVMDSMMESRKRLIQIRDQIIREDKAFDELNENVVYLFEQITTISEQHKVICELHEKVQERFGFEGMKTTLDKLNTRISSLMDSKELLKSNITERKHPNSTLLINYKDLNIECNEVLDEFEKCKQVLENACSDEARAKKQLLKLQLILNEINVKITKNRLPSISSTYEEDVHKANVSVSEIEGLLEATPLNVSVLNEKLKVSIDFIYTLYNSVNNLVGMANMVENTIVFGNRYRSSYPDIDSELTRAELCFRNGQYTKALKIAIQTIEKMHPGSYEKLIRDTKVSASE